MGKLEKSPFVGPKVSVGNLEKTRIRNIKNDRRLPAESEKINEKRILRLNS
ncbi:MULTISPECIES: hypothetical protein [Rhodonellum]|uniref:hypothetical protein n=1 Tax=Rhodonellum TaxID=336827 RepID=UPI0003A74618|nr:MULTISPECIES: hypothetical protein [Rhodonellum]